MICGLPAFWAGVATVVLGVLAASGAGFWFLLLADVFGAGPPP